jgi:hypothetical protein
MITVTLPVVVTALGVMVSYAAFQFGLFKWLISRIDRMGDSFKAELVQHQQADLEALREVRAELNTLQLRRTRTKR